MTTASAPPSVTHTGSADDSAAIHGVVADIETAFNTNDPELMTKHFAADGSAVDAMGRPLHGLSALREAADAGLSGFLRDQYVRYEVSGVDLLRADVAVAYKTARATDADGEPIGVGHEMVAMYVLVKEDGRWWIAARQNTLVPQPD